MRKDNIRLIISYFNRKLKRRKTYSVEGIIHGRAKILKGGN